MKCPNCAIELQEKTYHNIPIDECPNCFGMWFTIKELDELENTVLNDEDAKGTLIWDVKDSKRKCPVCDKAMKQFNYRLNDLFIEYCTANHGYWLDKDEADRVVENMKVEVEKLDRKYNVENKWTEHLNRLSHPSFISKLIEKIKE